jgi:hypothetical protein
VKIEEGGRDEPSSLLPSFNKERIPFSIGMVILVKFRNRCGIASLSVFGVMTSKDELSS